ncbi:alpha/beta hydrolase [Thermoactinomyces sp. CICC 10521]|nr:alpha/beta hydrolase [Thermoactinomyces sp. CICC 10523]MBH8605246.1 alpha/beta hydrolase [Thermoactinomyces sp. CICC 10522]MBH8608172.1 alpha/beta hydrolase [Thermoactinomyces sp. CICC 10521]
MMFKSFTPPYRDQKRKKIASSIAVLEKIPLGGISQSVLIRSRDTKHPLLLFIHGGPGHAQIGFARHYQEELEKHFIVVNWDQRGSGKSYSKRLDPASLTIEQLVADAHELIIYLLKRFGQKKLFLAGHSWGSIVAALVAKQYPELIHAYIGIGQMTDVEHGEMISYQMVLIYARQNEKFFAVRALNRIGYPPYRRIRDLLVQRKWLSKFGGDVRKGSLFSFLRRGLFSREYTLADWWRFFQGTRFTMKHLGPKIMQMNLFNEISELKVPAYFCVGRYDYLSPFELQEKFCEQLKAPKKDLIWFENSAHCPHFEEPSSFLVVLLRIKEETAILKRQTLSHTLNLKGALLQ